MKGRTGARTCTTAKGCTATPLYEVKGSGRLIGIPRGAIPKAVHLLACEAHLPAAQRQARNRTTKSTELLPPQQPTLFDQ